MTCDTQLLRKVENANATVLALAVLVGWNLSILCYENESGLAQGQRPRLNAWLNMLCNPRHRNPSSQSQVVVLGHPI